MCHQLLLASVVCCVVIDDARGTTYDQRPRPAVLFSDGQFVAQEAINTVTLHGATGTPVNKFVAAGDISHLAVTPDERYLALAGAGFVMAADLQSGKTMWSKVGAQSGLSHVYDVSFAWDGRTFVVSNVDGFVQIYETTTGKLIQTIRLPPNQTSVMSAALSPDGSTGVLVDLGAQVFTFDVSTGAMKPTGITGAWPIRYSADGRYFAFRSDNSGSSEHLRIVAVAAPTAYKDVCPSKFIGHIKPAKDRFLVTAEATDRNGQLATVGFAYTPSTAQLQRIWDLPGHSYDLQAMDFDEQKMLGLTTAVQLITKVTDLKTGAVLVTVNNNKNYQAIMLSTSSRGSGDGRHHIYLIVGAAVVGLLFTVLLLLFIRRRRRDGKGDMDIGL